MKKALLYDLICSFLLLLFLYTALSKLIAYQSFTAVLQKSPLLEQVAPVVAWLLPLGEIGIAVLLFFPNTRATGLYSSLIVLLGFTAYLSYMIAVSPQLPCSCGGVLKQMTWQQHLLFNAGCIGLSIAGIILHYSIKRNLLIRPTLPTRPPFPEN